MPYFKQSPSPLNLLVTTDYNMTNLFGTYAIVNGTKELKSLFGGHKFTPFPKGIPDPTTGFATQGSDNLHNDEVYELSTSELIKFSAQYDAMKLKAADFAYLKDIGVYPNNRLMIARRFPAPVGNDLTAFTGAAPTPLATLISWVGNDNDFIEISFAEIWEEADASFETILNDMGKDLAVTDDNRAGMSKTGTKLAEGLGSIPLPGLMEGLQQKLFVALGISDPAKNDLILPIADPNLIREARQRKVLEKGKAGSGLKTDFKIKMNVKYEQKYINGVDPTLVYFDIIGNVLSFATSDARFQFNESFASGTSGILKDLISGDVGALTKTIETFISKFTEVLTEQVKNITDMIKNIANKKTTTEENKSITNDAFKLTVGAIVGKYKEKIKGVIAALTGVASTPWHITIGNPKRPVFSSGDLYMDNVSLKLGPVLSYNDLPASIEIDFELKNARALGAQEIFNRFNTGRARTYQREPDFASANTSQKVVGVDPASAIYTNHGIANVSSTDNTVGGAGEQQNIGNNQNTVPASLGFGGFGGGKFGGGGASSGF